MAETPKGVEQKIAEGPNKSDPFELSHKKITFSMRELLEEMIRRGASDLHITVGSPPVLRVDGKIQRMPGEPVTEEISKRLTYKLSSGLSILK